MIDRRHQLTVTKQAKVFGKSGCLSFRRKPGSECVQIIMTRLDQLQMDWPFARARLLRDL